MKRILEIGTVIGKNHKGALLTVNGGGIRPVWTKLLDGEYANPPAEAAIDTLESFREQTHAIMADTEKNFSFQEEIARKLNIFVYFAKLYHSWERRASENSNGLIGQYFPKDRDFGDITEAQAMRVQNILNP